MKETIIYALGTLLWLPVAAAVCTQSVCLWMAAFLWGALLVVSPKVSKNAHRFWRAWHKVNFKITNIFKA